MLTAAVINYNTSELLLQCLESLTGVAFEEILVVDNASTDQSVAQVASHFPEVTLLVNPVNRGYASACNRAIEHCNSPFLLLLNSDTQLVSFPIKDILHYLQTHPEVAIAGPLLLNPDGTIQHSLRRFPSPTSVFFFGLGINRLISKIARNAKHRQTDAPWLPYSHVGWIMGAALILRVEPVRALGGFDENYFMYYEEVDLCHAVHLAGMEIHFIPFLEIMHIGGASAKQQPAAMQLELEWSAIRYYRKHFSSLRLSYLLLLVRVGALNKLILDFVRALTVRDKYRAMLYKDSLKIWSHVLLHGDSRSDRFKGR